MLELYIPKCTPYTYLYNRYKMGGYKWELHAEKVNIWLSNFILSLQGWFGKNKFLLISEIFCRNYWTQLYNASYAELLLTEEQPAFWDSSKHYRYFTDLSFFWTASSRHLNHSNAQCCQKDRSQLAITLTQKSKKHCVYEDSISSSSLETNHYMSCRE